MNLFKLVGSVYVDTDKANKSLQKTSGKADSLASKIGKGVGTAAKVGAAAIAAVGTAAVGVGASITATTKKVAEHGDAIDKASQKMGISAEAYQEWDAVLQHSGTSMDAMAGGFKTLANGIQNTSKRQAEAFSDLGLSMEQLKTMTPEEAFKTVINRLQSMEEGTERTAIANTLLGRSGAQLGALLNTSAEDTQKMIDKVHELGGVMSNEAVKNSARFQDSLQDMQTSIDGVKNKLGAEFLPAFADAMDGVADVASGKDSGFEKIGKAVENILNTIGKGAPKVAAAATSLIQGVINSVVQQLPTLTPMMVDLVVSMVNLITENLPTILQAVFDAFVQLSTLLAEKIPELVPQIMEFVVQLLQMVAENIDQIVGVATVLVKAIADALVQAMPVLIEAMPELIGALIPALIEASVQLFAVGPELISAIVGGLVASLPLLIEKIPEIIGEIIMAFQDNSDEFIEIGANIIDGIWGGIKNGWDGLVKNVKRLANKLVSGVKETLGIHSPSKVFAEIGKFSAQGISQGWDDEITNVSANMQDSMGGVVGSVSEVATNQTSAGDSGVYSLLEKYLPTLGNSQIVLDTGALVGNTVNKTNEALGNIGKYQARGVLI